MPIILPQTAEVKITKTNIEHYKSKGYDVKLRDIVNINVLNLYTGSHFKIKCKCDYCDKEILKEFRAVNQCKNVKSQLKICCNNFDCIQLKMKETNFNKYGVEHACQSEEIKEKIKQTNLERYGVENPWQSEKVKDKIKQTMINNYGVDNYSKTNEFKEKSEKHFLKKYGVKNPMQIEEIKNKALTKANQTMYENGNGPKGMQQTYISNLLNGELNYPIGVLKLDVAFPKEMIYIEYDGGGHGWWAKSNLSEEFVTQIDIKRQKFLQSLGWKIIRIISAKDWIPQDSDIINLINEAKQYLLNSNHSWYRIDIDKKQIECREYIKLIELNKLRRIRKEDINE